MASNCAETAPNGLDSAIADVAVVGGEIPRCLAVAPSASAATRLSGFPPYVEHVQPLPSSSCDKPAARRLRRQCDSIGMQQQHLRPNNDDQIFVSGTARRSHPTHSNHPVVVVTPATAGAVPNVPLGLNPVETPVPHRRQGCHYPKPHAAAIMAPPRSASGAGTARCPQVGTESPAPATSH